MCDNISVTPSEYVSFIEFCDKGHSANKHGSKMVVAVVRSWLKSLVSITRQMRRPRYKNKAIMRLSSHPSS